MSKTGKYILYALLSCAAIAICKGMLVKDGPEPGIFEGKAHGQLIVFHAGSLSVPFREICEEFSKDNPQINVIREAAGSRACARKICDLKKPCDVIASADYMVIDTLLIPEYADWNIKFTANEMAIAFIKDSKWAGKINKDNWYELLLNREVSYGRSDPNLDPCGYRSVITIGLAEQFYSRRGLRDEMLAKDTRYMRPKEVDLLSLLEVGELDFIFIYRSVAWQHGLGILRLPDEINLKKAEFADYYKRASVNISGKKPGTFITRPGAPILYGLTIPKNAPNRAAALLFADFLLDCNKGGAILERNGQPLRVPLPTESFENVPEQLRDFALQGERGNDR
jgi:molybdate/tungstate transport system substrate-binding protein